jgi:hypothetical protein
MEGHPLHVDLTTLQAGRFVLYQPSEEGDVYITSWDTWEQCEAAFPIEGEAILHDLYTGRRWTRGCAYEWEAAAT